MHMLPDRQAGAQMLSVSVNCPSASVDWPGGVVVYPPKLQELGLDVLIASVNGMPPLLMGLPLLSSTWYLNVRCTPQPGKLPGGAVVHCDCDDVLPVPTFESL